MNVADPRGVHRYLLNECNYWLMAKLSWHEKKQIRGNVLFAKHLPSPTSRSFLFVAPLLWFPLGMLCYFMNLWSLPDLNCFNESFAEIFFDSEPETMTRSSLPSDQNYIGRLVNLGATKTTFSTTRRKLIAS